MRARPGSRKKVNEIATGSRDLILRCCFCYFVIAGGIGYPRDVRRVRYTSAQENAATLGGAQAAS